MDKNDLEVRVKSLEDKSLFWQAAAIFFAVLVALEIYRSLPSYLFWIFVCIGIVIWVGYSAWSIIKPVLVKVSIGMIVFLVILTYASFLGLKTYQQNHPDEHWSFSTWSFIAN